MTAPAPSFVERAHDQEIKLDHHERVMGVLYFAYSVIGLGVLAVLTIGVAVVNAGILVILLSAAAAVAVVRGIRRLFTR